MFEAVLIILHFDYDAVWLKMPLDDQTVRYKFWETMFHQRRQISVKRQNPLRTVKMLRQTVWLKHFDQKFDRVGATLVLSK